MMQHKQGLIEVTVGNYRSVKDEACLSMLAANLRARDREIDATHPFRVIDNCTLLTSAAIFGANASGKSNFLDALDFMRSMVIRPANGLHSDESIPVSPFLFSTTTEQKPSLFQTTGVT
jgi:AAA15 family ATPase/GTPase